MSKIVVGQSHTTYVGEDATRYFRVKVLKGAIELAKKGIRVSRAYGVRDLLNQAGKVTGKTYKRGAYDAAIADLQQWLVTMKAALPIEKDNRGF